MPKHLAEAFAGPSGPWVDRGKKYLRGDIPAISIATVPEPLRVRDQ